MQHEIVIMLTILCISMHAFLLLYFVLFYDSPLNR